MPVTRLLWAVIIATGLCAAFLYAHILRGFFTADGFRLAADLECFRANGAYLGRHVAAAAAAAEQACVFKYPPPFLLLAAPLSWLAPLPVFAVWSLLSAAIFILAGRGLGLAWRGCGLALLAPPVLLCLTIGQDGIFLSMALVYALALADAAPLAAGAIAGVLVLKPNLGLLVPFCYLGARNWRAIAAAAGSAAVLCLLSWALFGTGVWRGYLLHGGGVAALMAQPWPQNYQHILITPFIFMRALGGGVLAAYAVQAAVSLAALGAAWRLWANREPGLERLALSLCLAALVAPYAYVYDLPGLALALVALAAREGWRHMSVLTWFWGFTGIYIFVATFFAPLGAPCLALMVPALWRRRGTGRVAA